MPFVAKSFQKWLATSFTDISIRQLTQKMLFVADKVKLLVFIKEGRERPIYSRLKPMTLKTFTAFKSIIGISHVVCCKCRPILGQIKLINTSNKEWRRTRRRPDEPHIPQSDGTAGTQPLTPITNILGSVICPKVPMSCRWSRDPCGISTIWKER